MAELLSASDWAKFTQAINDAGDTFNKMPIIWRRFTNFVGSLNEWNEDIEQSGTYEDVDLLCLFSDNYFHSWPITKKTDAGELDNQNTVAIFNTQYLRDLGYINADGNFDIDEGRDRFIYNGMTYKSEGFTDMAQAEDNKLLVMVILRKEEAPTGTDVNR